MSIVRRLKEEGLLGGIKPYAAETHYEVIMGSFAYGVSSDLSDTDVYGFFSPPIEMVFPHIAGHIYRFGKPPEVFETYQKHHIIDPTKQNREYDISLQNIVKFFNLCMDNNPNMLDCMFVPRRCIVHMDEVGELVRSHRKMFLHKGSWHKLKGYAYGQMKKIRTKKATGKRAEAVEKYGYDVKFAYHVVRLLNEGEQILVEHDLDLERSRAQLKSIRAGEWTLDEIEAYFKKKEAEMDTVYLDSDLRHSPDVENIKKLLLECLEIRYGSLSNYISTSANGETALQLLAQIRELVNT